MLTLVDDGALPGPALFETVIPVRWGDMDSDGHVNNTVMLRFAEEARMQWAAALDLERRAPDRMPIVASVGCSFQAAVHYPARLRVRVSCPRVGRTSLHLAFSIDVLDAAGAARPCASACAVWVWVDKESRRPVPVPDALRDDSQSFRESTMNAIESKFSRLGTDDAPGQEVRQNNAQLQGRLIGDRLAGTPVDFSHGDVDTTAFEPTPGAFDEFTQGVARGGNQAYTEYRGGLDLRESLADRLGAFTGRPISGADELIITPGTQGALFLAVAATVAAGDKVAIVRPDYFANRKIVEFLGGEVVPVRMNYLGATASAGIDLGQLEAAFQAGAKTFLFSNPNNPAGVVYSKQEIGQIAALANRYGATVIVDQLYSRLLYAGREYTHLRATQIDPSNVLTIMGPSKTESLSGYRLGVAFGAGKLIDRMEKLQAIVSLRAPGYCQAVLRTWFAEPQGWMANRVLQHQAIRDDLLKVLSTVEGMAARTPDAGSYLFPRLPALNVDLQSFTRILRIQADVTVTPGTEFSPDATDSIRLNFSQNHRAAVQGLERAMQLVERYRAPAKARR